MIHSAVRAPSATNRTPGVRPSTAAAPAAVRIATKRGSGVGVAFWFLVFLAVIAGGFFYLRGTDRPTLPAEPAAAQSATPAYPAVDPLDLKNVVRYKGETITIEGVVTSVPESKLFSARLLAYSDRPDAAVLSIADNLMTMETARSLVGQRVHAVGQVSTAANRTRLVIASVADLKANCPPRRRCAGMVHAFDPTARRFAIVAETRTRKRTSGPAT